MADSDRAVAALHRLARALEAQRLRPDLSRELITAVHRLVERVQLGEDASFLDSDVSVPDPDVQALVDLIEQAGVPSPSSFGRTST